MRRRLAVLAVAITVTGSCDACVQVSDPTLEGVQGRVTARWRRQAGEISSVTWNMSSERGDFEHLAHSGMQHAEPQASCGRLARREQGTDPGRVDERHVSEVDDDLTVTVGDRALQLSGQDCCRCQIDLAGDPHTDTVRGVDAYHVESRPARVASLSSAVSTCAAHRDVARWRSQCCRGLDSGVGLVSPSREPPNQADPSSARAAGVGRGDREVAAAGFDKRLGVVEGANARRVEEWHVLHVDHEVVAGDGIDPCRFIDQPGSHRRRGCTSTSWKRTPPIATRSPPWCVLTAQHRA